MATINTIDINWFDLFNSIPGFETDVQNRLRIRREIIPILFVPGIMGSRLITAQGHKKGGKKKAWDPDARYFMLKKFGYAWVTASERKALLVGKKFNAGYLAVDNNDAKHNKRLASPNDRTRAKRGWGGVYWKIYGRFLSDLQDHQWPEPLGHCFEFPVHAFGYNWSASSNDSGRKLREYIDKTIGHYKNGLKDEAGRPLPRECNQVILVTHSMGGLVARSACLLHGAEKAEKVLGVVHGVQPTTGSPAAYWRMKAGFERSRFTVEGDEWWRFVNPLKLVDAVGRKLVGNITAATLGTNGEEVTSLLANMPGGLQLLPNAQYRDNTGRSDWLAYDQPDGTTLNLPKTDPYQEIYLEQSAPWRMVNPEWIDPGASKNDISINPTNTPWRRYHRNLAEAKSFHTAMANLENQAHDDTVQFYATGIDSPDRVCYSRLSHPPRWDPFRDMELIFRFNNKGEYRGYVDERDMPLPSSEGAAAIVALAMPKGSGDGTVPDCSGRALSLAPERTVAIGDMSSGWPESPFERGHEGVYQTESAKKIVIGSIINLALKRIETVRKKKV